MLMPNVVALYIWIFAVELSLCLLPGTWNFEVIAIVLENL
jgi:hypothetical protein